jgi:translation initiation factor 4G
VLKVGENAYKIMDRKTVTLDREAELKRTAMSLLNKICPENVKTIAQRLKTECQVDSSEELGHLIGHIFKKALAEPHYCETYADLVFDLKGEMPQFPCPNGGKPLTFKSTLLNVCQGEFEAMPKTLAPTAEEIEKLDPEEIAHNQGAQKKKFLANMVFIGNLFLRGLLTTKIIAGVMSDLMMCESDSAGSVPEEHVVECVCELLSTIGYTLEQQPVGQQAIVQVCGKMLEVKNAKKKDGKTGVLSKRIQFQIQDLLDMRNKGWTKKVFKATAKTKEEIRLEAIAAEKGVKPGEIKVHEYVVAGQRPTYLAAEGGAGAVGAPANGSNGDWATIPKKAGGGRR